MPIRDVGDAMREMRAGSKHIRTRAQAIAVGLKERRKRGRAGRDGRSGSAASAYVRGLMGGRR